tara:strand:+ start:510 stop:1010 length:501 start_codon:yes stop_codon:yes gene_type:complete
VSKQTEGDRQMTSTKTDILEVLNSYGLTETDHSNGSQLGYKRKYIYTCFMGSLHRVVNQLKNEYNTGGVVLQELIDEDNDMDSKGGYGRMAIERRMGFGFPTDIDKLQEKLAVLHEDYVVVKDMYDSHNDTYESLYGSKFDPDIKSKKKLTTAKKAQIAKKFVPIS